MTQDTPIPPDVTRPRRSDAERQLPTGTEPVAGMLFELHTADTFDSPVTFFVGPDRVNGTAMLSPAPVPGID